MFRNNIWLSVIIFVLTKAAFSQGITNIWQLSYNNSIYPKCYLDFSSGNPVSNFLTRPMNFDATSTTICDNNGNMLFYSNGVYIADATHDTMQNGSNLSPSNFTTSWSVDGLPIFQGVLALPWPGDASKYILIHETGNYATNGRPVKLYYSKINMNLNGGLGGVTQKNVVIINDTIEGGMITGCRHANGRDWWVLAHKNFADLFYKILITPSGIASIDTQSVGGPISQYGGQAAFSPDGNWYATFDNLSKLRLYNFDRCTGLLYNLSYINIPDVWVGGGLSFSSNSQLLYISNSKFVYQFDVTVANIASSQLLIATFDSLYYSPWPPFQCNFWWHMMGPNGKIYINSAASVVDLNVINYPDSLGISCNLQQHSYPLGTFNVHTFPNHINYYLGPVDGSICDSLGINTSISENNFNFNISVFPNPVTYGQFSVNYFLPQNKSGSLSVFDINGKTIYSVILPQWSTLQKIKLPLASQGIYAMQIKSGSFSATRKIIVE